VTDRPLPAIDADTKPYWEAAREGRLLVQRCDECGAHQFPPRRRCVRCGGAVSWVAASGRGTVYAFTVVHRAAHEAFADLVPYVVALIDLAEGVRLMTRLQGAAPDAVRIGLPASVAFEKVTDDVTLPYFTVSA